MAWILPENKPRANDINNADELTAEALSLGSTGPGRCAVCLARITAADKVHAPLLPPRLPEPRRLSGWRERPNIVPPGNIGPVLREYLVCIFIALDLPFRYEATGVFKSFFEATDFMPANKEPTVSVLFTGNLPLSHVLYVENYAIIFPVTRTAHPAVIVHVLIVARQTSPIVSFSFIGSSANIASFWLSKMGCHS